MINSKKTWTFLFGLVFLGFVVPFAFAQVDAPAAATAVCLIGDHLGVPDADAQTSAMLVCEQLRKQGISVSDPVYEAPASASVYRVVFRRLGEKIFVRLSQENPVGTVIIERQMMLTGVEEMVSAAPRLVDALVHNTPVGSTVDMMTVTEDEARELRKVTGESHFSIGFFAAFIPGTNVSGTPGYRFGWSYELPSYAVEVGGRIVTDEDEEEDRHFTFAAFSTGVLYFLNKQNTSLFAGGGITAARARSWTGFWLLGDDEEFDRGMGVYAVGGIQMLRLTQNRLKFELRVDRPLFTLPSNDVMPITVGLFYSRHYTPGGCCLF